MQVSALVNKLRRLGAPSSAEAEMGLRDHELPSKRGLMTGGLGRIKPLEAFAACGTVGAFA